MRIRNIRQLVAAALVTASGCTPADFMPQGDPSDATVSTEPPRHPVPATRLHALLEVKRGDRAGFFSASSDQAACAYEGKPGLDASGVVSYVGGASGEQLRLTMPRLIDARTSTNKFTLAMTYVAGPGQPPIEIVADPANGNGFGYVKVGGPETEFRIELFVKNRDSITVSGKIECTR